jgi:hypothetical protein
VKTRSASVAAAAAAAAAVAGRQQQQQQQRRWQAGSSSSSSSSSTYSENAHSCPFQSRLCLTFPVVFIKLLTMRWLQAETLQEVAQLICNLAASHLLLLNDSVGGVLQNMPAWANCCHCPDVNVLKPTPPYPAPFLIAGAYLPCTVLLTSCP